MKNTVFWASGIHPFNSPLPFDQNEKNKIEFFLRASRLNQDKEKHVHHITAYIWFKK